MVKDPPAHVRDLSDGSRQAVADDQKIVVLIQRESVRVVGAFGDLWREGEGFSKCASGGEPGGGDRHALKKTTPIDRDVKDPRLNEEG